VKIGLSLPLDYLTGTPVRPGSQLLAKALGEPYNALALLQKHGVDSVELQRIGISAPPTEVLDAVQCILDTGLHLTIHGTLVRDAEGQSLSAQYPHLLPVLQYLREQQQETILVVHAHANTQSSTFRLLVATVHSIVHLIHECIKHKLPLKVGLEINRYHGRSDPGTTYEGLHEIAQRVNSPNLGFCWDMGHTQSSILQNMLPVSPPPAFLENVIHTHVHGIAPDGDTHWPLIDSFSHIREGIQQLKAYGYSGTYNLELYPERWGQVLLVSKGVLDSIDILCDLLMEEGIL
jgi:sugar phosphate isomerase/epimerase